MVILSIILPVYNVEQYIQRCINSIYTGVTVNLDNFEVIFVNDASPDKSREIIENAQMYYRNIILINQENRKAGGARNTGMRAASRKYILFVDPDDTLEPNVVNHFIPILENEEVDVLMCDNNVHLQGRIYTDRYNNPENIISGMEHFLRNRVTWSPCISFYKRNYLLNKNLFFAENVSFEDVDWVIKTQILANTIKCLPVVIYNYYQNPTSQTRTNPSYKKVHDWFLMGKRILDFAPCQTVDNQCAMRIKNHAYLVFKRGIRSSLFISTVERYELFRKFIYKENFGHCKILNLISYFPCIMSYLLTLLFPAVFIAKKIRDRQEYK